ncbi:unnamed protein product [Pleuronectes platessa]|uniref:Uncharacterized protein n=1 Tax=Pleuronectes platessa TaxID=8262 RepID=A0A9N7TM06_PLEPL|nr:unnamed protein product [Pleuronectes platessa]
MIITEHPSRAFSKPETKSWIATVCSPKTRTKTTSKERPPPWSSSLQSSVFTTSAPRKPRPKLEPENHRELHSAAASAPVRPACQNGGGQACRCDYPPAT